MSLQDGRTEGQMPDLIPDLVPDLVMDPVLKQALGNFRQSVQAWSDAAYSRPRTAAQVVARRSWRLAVGWALGCVLATGSLAGGLYEHHYQQQAMARIKAAQEAKQSQLARQQRAGAADEDLLAAVDSDISRSVPAALEPLAQLMDGDEDQ
jgi:hypothetical protein